MKSKLILLLSFLVAACGPVTLPPTPHPPPYTTRYIHFNVVGESGNIPILTGVSIADDFGHHYSCPVLVENMVECLLDQNIPLGDPTHPEAQLAGGHIYAQAPHYDPYIGAFTFNGLSQDLPTVRLQPTFRPLVGIHPEGQHFRLDNGERFTLIGATDFNLLGRYLVGEDIDPILAQRRDLGFNSLRVFTAIDVPGIGSFWPAQFPDFYQQISRFLDKLAVFNLRAELVGFSGPYGFFTGDDAKVDHWNRLVAAVQGKTNVTLELVNEGDHVANKDIPFDRLGKPAGVLASHGSSTEDTLPVTPFWDLITFHPSADTFWRKAGHNCGELWDGPCVSNEFSRSPDREALSIHWEDAGKGCALLAAGCVLHSVDGKSSTLFSGVELENAQAFVRGMKSVPLACQNGGYVHRGDLEVPGIIRAYQRGNDPACIVLIRE